MFSPKLSKTSELNLTKLRRKIKIPLSTIETVFNFEQLRGKHESIITSDLEEKIK